MINHNQQSSVKYHSSATLYTIGDKYSSYPVNTGYLYNICTMLDQRRRRWSDVVRMEFKCFVFSGKSGNEDSSK